MDYFDGRLVMRFISDEEIRPAAGIYKNTVQTKP
jgi:hypothetical protein